MAISQMVESTRKGVFVQGTAQTGFVFLWKLGYDFCQQKDNDTLLSEGRAV